LKRIVISVIFINIKNDSNQDDKGSLNVMELMEDHDRMVAVVDIIVEQSYVMMKSS